jgi:hypothetical protein
MANKIQFSNLTATTFVDVTSRYADSRVAYYGDDHIVTFATYKRKKPFFSKNDKFYLITQATQYRPDLVSQLAYGVPSFWWRIMEANFIKDISDFKQGVTIRIPESLF